MRGARFGGLSLAYSDAAEFRSLYTPPGHRPYVDAGTELLQFSPTAELAKTEKAIQDWMGQQQGG